MTLICPAGSVQAVLGADGVPGLVTLICPAGRVAAVRDSPGGPVPVTLICRAGSVQAVLGASGGPVVFVLGLDFFCPGERVKAVFDSLAWQAKVTEKGRGSFAMGGAGCETERSGAKVSPERSEGVAGAEGGEVWVEAMGSRGVLTSIRSRIP